MNNELYHYGTPHYMSIPHSGRYKYGSGEEPYQHAYDAQRSFLNEYRRLKSEKIAETKIAEYFNLSVDELRKKNSLATAAERAGNITRAKRLKEHGNKVVTIAKIMDVNESTVRGWLAADENKRVDRINKVADVLEKRVKKGQMIDVGYGVELDLNVTKTTFDTALKALKDKGYVVDTIDVPQPNLANASTKVRVLAPEGTTKKDIWVNRGDIKTLTEYMPKDTTEIRQVEYPESIDSKRIFVNYTNADKTKGGIEKDGLIEIRRNVPDLSLGNSSYAQIRMAIDGHSFMKGMAIYSDNIPDGYDVVVNTNKVTGTPLFKTKGYDGEAVFKKLKDDPEMPFGATVYAKGQNHYIDKDGNERLGLINKLRDEGEWGQMNKSLSSQFLSKQPIKLIDRQLDLTYRIKADEFNEIMEYTNPVVKKKLLMDFAEGCDKDAKHLNAAAFPRQNTKVIIPIPEMKDNEVYAPTYKNGEHLCLVRFPHGGTFEIPELVVNNNNRAAKKLMGNAKDAVGINSKVAGQLSGADFDGDFVLAIPTNENIKIKTSKPLENLKNFSTTDAYPKYEGMKPMTSREHGIQMGVVSNLITDMTLRNATIDEVERAVRHSMVVVDAEKHELNWRQSEKDNGIDALKRKYQIKPGSKKGYGGSSTLISRAEAEVKVDEIQRVDKNGKKTYTPDPETGKWFYAETGRTYTKYKRDSKGNIKYDDDGNPITEKVKYKTATTAMDLTDDAFTLSSGTIQEASYAKYANNMKALANQARKEAVNLDLPKASASAKQTYSEEIKSLNAKLELAKSNKPLERQAIIKSSVRIEKLKEDNPDMKKDKLKKEKARILNNARAEVGAGKQSIEVSDREWEAIQARAISPTKLKEILDNANMETIKKRATPRKETSLSATKISRIKSLDASGLTIAEIADSLGVSTSTVSKYLND